MLVRSFDALSKVGSWAPCPETAWCAKYRFIWPSSIVNRNHNKVMYRGDAGLVLAPPPYNRFFCVYPGDGNSMGHYGDNHGCQEPCVGRRVWDCAYEPERLEEALTTNSANSKYNEVVVDAQYMKQHLPHSLMGVYWMGDAGRAGAADVHSDFLRAFSLTAKQFPLLHFDLQHGFSSG